MSARKVYLYRLNVTLPPEAADPDWEPDGWATDPHNAGQGFQWPRVTRYLSLHRAECRAYLLRKYGAQVTVERSAPVTWPGAAPEGGAAS
jgi:hypothetical protein